MSTAREILRKHIDEEVLMYYPDISHYAPETYERILVRWSDDSVYSEKHRFDLLEQFIPDAKSKKILDMAGGCGSFVLQGLRNGFNTYGVEPEEWKHGVIDIKFKENDYPSEWREHMVKGVGEKLPFEDETFDAFDSWQTIEHVADERDCITELYRVTKKGGSGIVRGPSYHMFYEGHYRMFWFPMMGKGAFARMYLKMRKRPFAGLDTFHPVNPIRIRRYAREAGFKVINIKRVLIYDAAKRKMPILKKGIFKPALWCIYLAWDFYRGIKGFGRSEATVSYHLVKE